MKATLVVSFGSTYTERYERVFSPLISELKQQGEHAVYECITSRFVKRKVEKDSLEEALEKIKADGVKELDVLGVFRLPAHEFIRMKHKIGPYRKHFRVRFTGALLGTLEDQARVLELLEETINESGHRLVMLAHSSTHPAGAILSQLQMMSEHKGFKHTYASIDGYPEVDLAIKGLSKDQPIVLAPMLFVAGDHANNDLLEFEQELQALGHQVITKNSGLGEYAAFRNLLLEKLQ